MPKEQEALKNLTSTLAKYKANREKVSLEELRTKYKKAFANLTLQLKEETSNYFTIVMLDGMLILKEKEKETLAAIEADIKKHKMGSRAGAAVFKNFNLEELKELALEQRRRNFDIILAHKGGIRA